MPIDFQGKGQPLTQAGFDAAIARLEVSPAALWSLITVETRGFGYLPDRRPKILFERHIFHRRTDGEFDRTAPDISSPDAGGYIGNEAEYNRLARAMELNRKAALERFVELVRKAAEPPPPPRIRTKPTRGSVQRRLAGKSIRSGIKAGRAKVSDEDDA